jgi:hypothetical protein
VFADLHVIPLPIVFYCDNNNALHIMTNIVIHKRAKRPPTPKTQLSKIVLASSDQTFDLFTKVLHPKHFHHFASKVSMVDFIFNLLDWRRVLHVSKPKLVS